MKSALCASICFVLLFVTVAHATEDENRFDGDWNTILTCPDSHGALGYSFQFLSTVKDGVLHGEKGTKGEAGWLQIDGEISPDGTADLYADGLVGAASYAVGQRPAGTQYNYHISAKFSGASGNGHRLEGRKCNFEFSKK